MTAGRASVLSPVWRSDSPRRSLSHGSLLLLCEGPVQRVVRHERLHGKWLHFFEGGGYKEACWSGI